jgi:predicted secreted Zn-dependent protease/pimeloyl-ACP methyl ester carboxylesterase
MAISPGTYFSEAVHLEDMRQRYILKTEELPMFSSLLRIAVVALLGCSIFNAAMAKPRVSVKTKYFSVTGTTANELRAQMVSKGPNPGEFSSAYTKWYVRWTGSCRTSVTITYTYPKWENRTQASVSLQKIWDRYVANLRTHEKGHGQHGINAAAEIERSRCKGNPKAIINKWAQEDRAYDIQTAHGKTQGVSLEAALPAVTAKKALCDMGNELAAVAGNGLCLAIRTFNADPKRDFQPTLVVMLHGDISKGGPADYHIRRMRELAQDEKIVSVAMIRPGYNDQKGRKSEGSNYGRKDSYTKDNNMAVGEAIQHLKNLHNAQRVILVGHAGGAAMAGVIIGMFPGLVDKAILVSCPCNIALWRKMRRGKPWKRSLSPSSYIKKIPLGTEVVAITGKHDRNTRPRLATEYVSSLKKRNIKAKLIIADRAAHRFDEILWYPTSEEIW